MRNTYSLYEAKAKLSAIVRQVREGRRIIVTVRGEPVAEIRPVDRSEGGIEARLASLEERGAVIRRRPGPLRLQPVVKRPGALARFLAERE